MKDKKFKCWTKIRKILNAYGYSYMDMLEYLPLIDISRMRREFEYYIKQITHKEYVTKIKKRIRKKKK